MVRGRWRAGVLPATESQIHPSRTCRVLPHDISTVAAPTYARFQSSLALLAHLMEGTQSVVSKSLLTFLLVFFQLFGAVRASGVVANLRENVPGRG